VPPANLVDDRQDETPIFRARRLDRALLLPGQGSPDQMSSAMKRPGSRLARRLGRLAAALGAAAAIFACNAPFIPVPPPGQQETSFSSQLVDDGKGGQKTMWVARGLPGQAPAYAQVAVFDDTLGLGVIGLAMSDGSYVSPLFEGTRGDRVEISYNNGSVPSAPVCYQLIEGASAPRCNPP
jgi:hypothetical protein